MIRKLKSGKYRLYSRKKDPKTGKRRNLGTFDTKKEAKQLVMPTRGADENFVTHARRSPATDIQVGLYFIHQKNQAQ